MPRIMSLSLVAAAALSIAAGARGDILQTGGVTISPTQVIVGVANNDGTLRVTPPSTLTATSMLIAQAGSPVPVNGSVFIEGAAANISQQLTVGVLGNGLLSVTDGGIVDATSGLILGEQANAQFSSRGTLIVDGPNSLLRFRSKLTIGLSGDAEVKVTNGGGLVPNSQATSAETVIASNPGSIGVVTIDGAGSRWQTPSALIVGNGGTGTLRILNGGVVTSATGRVGGPEGRSPAAPPSQAIIRGIGSRWSANTLTVTNGEVRIDEGGTLDTSVPQTGGVSVIGDGGASTLGRVVVDGPDSRWISNGDLTIARSNGAGELYLQNGTVFQTRQATIGESGSALAVVRGEFTRWASQGLKVGGAQGFGELRIEDGAEMTFGSLGGVMAISAGSKVVLNSGDLNSASVGVNSGQIRNSGLVTGSGRVKVGDFQNAGGTIRVEHGDKLRFTNVTSTQGGVVEIAEGELELGGVLNTSADSSIYAAGATIRTGSEDGPGTLGFRNGGQAYFTGGDNRVFGNVENTRSIVVTGHSDATFYRNLTNNGTVKASAGTTLTVLGAYSGNGVTGPGEVFLEGPVSPGMSPGKMDFGGDVTLGDLSALAIEVAGAGDPGVAFDQMNSVGMLTLGGDLSIHALGELSQAVTLPIVTAAELVGKFGSIPELGASLDYGVRFGGLTYDYAAGKVLVSLLPTQKADFNLDGLVDGTDLLEWQAELGTSELAPGSGADANGDGVVTAADLGVWQAEFQSEPPFTLSAAVPEPHTAVLLVAALGGLRFRRPLRLPL